MFRSKEEMALRDSICEDIKQAFERAGVGVVCQRNSGVPYSSVIAYLNYGFGGQRQALVMVADIGDCHVYMSRIYDVPAGKQGRDIDPGEMPLLFALPGTTPNFAETIVRKIREASIESSETMRTNSSRLQTRPSRSAN